MTKTEIGIALFGCLILGVMMLANSPLEAKNSNPNNDKPEYAKNEIVVKFEGDEKPFRVIKVKEGKVEEKVKEYKNKANVVYAEPNYIFYAMETDTYYWNQWALNNTGQDIYNKVVLDCIESTGNSAVWCCNNTPKAICKFDGTPGADIDWEEASNFTFSTPTIIAILDTGIDDTHPDLDEKLIAGKNFTKKGGPNNTNDIFGHGTHVAGTAGAETNNGIGIAGVAFSDNVKIMPVKVLNDYGSSVSTSVADGIYYAADNGAKVINLSLGGTYYSNTLKNAVDYAWGRGVLIAASAGNDGDEVKHYPASYPNVMSVAATDYNDDTASFSTFNDEIDISAPGVNVFSTFPTYEFTIQGLYGRSQNYDVGSGTSMSCPHIAGLAGLLFAQDNSRTNDKVREIIEQSADDLGDTGWDKYFGHGRINVYAALTYSPCNSNEDCDSGKICCSGECITPTCTEGGSECDDGETCTADSCANAGTCDAFCANTWPDCGIEDVCCGPDCTSANDPDCSVNPCATCFKGRCNGVCTKKDDQTYCPDCF